MRNKDRQRSPRQAIEYLVIGVIAVLSISVPLLQLLSGLVREFL